MWYFAWSPYILFLLMGYLKLIVWIIPYDPYHMPHIIRRIIWLWCELQGVGYDGMWTVNSMTLGFFRTFKDEFWLWLAEVDFLHYQEWNKEVLQIIIKFNWNIVTMKLQFRVNLIFEVQTFEKSSKTLSPYEPKFVAHY